MHLIRAEIKNFKLLENVRVSFSTDPSRPLTVIRAENGSGKTSLLYALLWSFYGIRGLPEAAQQLQQLRLTSSAVPAGKPIDVSVMLEFEHVGDLGESSRYRLIRSLVETPAADDKIERHGERVRLMRITSAGEKEVDEALIGKLVPFRLRDVFFTNGDDVQRFISGQVSTTQRQAQVHQSIRSLLGIDSLRIAKGDAEAVFKRLRGEAAKSGGSDTSALEEALDQTDSGIREIDAKIARLNEQLSHMAEQRVRWEKELLGIRGIGDLDELNDRIERAQKERDSLEAARTRALVRMREAIKSESCSWALLGPYLDEGLKILGDLADRNIIPGTSVEVLRDRLELEQCICGESLTAGSTHRHTVENLLRAQERVSESRQRLTELFHVARQLDQAEKARIDSGESFLSARTHLLRDFIEAREALRTKAAEIEQLKERRSLIDEERVQDLTDKLNAVEKKIADSNEEVGGYNERLAILTSRREEEEDKLREAEKAAKVRGDVAIKRDVAEDLLALASGTLRVLESDYVKRVSDRMNELFMWIVGADEAFEAAVFRGVHIDDRFNIVVDTHRGRRLDPDFELNGAAQRALTLSFIWALMEVSATTAPRLIDTPLGMVSGGVKTRMVDTITRPPTKDLPDFQVILLLTRSEIRDVEELLDERAGVVQTLSCSQQYPEDLVYPWAAEQPLSRMCTCNHRQSCRVCARKYDSRHGIAFRDLEANV